MRKLITLFFLINSVLYLKSQEASSSDLYGEFLYEQAFEKLNCMLKDSCSISIKEAVFEVEYAYSLGKLNKEAYKLEIERLSFLVRAVMKSNAFEYEGRDKLEMTKNAALFAVMCDTIPVQVNDSTIINHTPYTYDFRDIWGYNSWGNMFVTKLLRTKSGNCHSLPFLYKILAEEIGATAYLAIAPNHFYIKHFSKDLGWYNTELTSGQFPMDSWLKASGYVHLDAIVNKLYMEAINDKQFIAVCMVDLAKGYRRKYAHTNSGFTMKCIDTALKHYPHYVNALLLKMDLLQDSYLGEVQKQGAEYAAGAFNQEEAINYFEELERRATELHELGYRRMPEKMYLNWLSSLKEEREKYSNKKLLNFQNK
jgi:hypothetical protein